MKQSKNGFILTCLAAIVLGIGTAGNSRADETTTASMESQDPYYFLRIDSNGNVYASATIGRGLKFAKADISQIKALVAKFAEWSKIAKENHIVDIQKEIGRIGQDVAKMQISSGRSDGSIDYAISIQDHYWHLEELQGVIKLLDQLPELEQHLEKADRLLK